MMRGKNIPFVFFTMTLFFMLFALKGTSQHSIAREWNEILLESIRSDYARPTVHARNLFHISAAMYDAWTIVFDKDETYLIGKTVHGFNSSFDGFHPAHQNKHFLASEAMSYAAHRLIAHRFAKSPGIEEIMNRTDELFNELGFDYTFRSLDYHTGSAAALGNYIASQYIAYGLVDGSNEADDYENLFYQPVNDPINLKDSGNPNLTDPNRWQPITFDLFIDQSGNETPGSTPKFLGPEWGQVHPFSLNETHKTLKERDGNRYTIYHDPGPPPYLDTINGGPLSEFYQWNFSLVAIWSSHLDAALDKEIDISPASLGNLGLNKLPTSFDEYKAFYGYLEGGDGSSGHDSNPITGTPYTPQIVRLGDYARILAEFWADGPDSETPPGHWFTILNYVNDQPGLVRKLEGQGPELDPLEWDTKAYFILGGAMHDAAVTAWSIKGYYDYVRPVSAIRYMAAQGQCSNPELANYSKNGIPLVEGVIEVISEGDPLAGDAGEHVDKIKLKAWRGPDYINDPDTDIAGVGWIPAENWWPYQRPTFITPPFAGYISGHSTFSRAAAEVLTRLTGDAFFPGGQASFHARKNEFLVFEDGPSKDIALQWATYQDASDECSLSRIWGGIHPPVDDIPGRIIGYKVGNKAFNFARQHFHQTVLRNDSGIQSIQVYPNPASNYLHVQSHEIMNELLIYDLSGKIILRKKMSEPTFNLDVSHLPAGHYMLIIHFGSHKAGRQIVIR